MESSDGIILVGWGDLSGDDLDFIENTIIEWKGDGKPEDGWHRCLFKDSCSNGCPLDKIDFRPGNNLCNAIIEGYITLNEVLELVADELSRRR